MDSKKVPLWKMALMASPGSFGAIPANLTLNAPDKKNVPEMPKNKITPNEAKKEKPKLHYTAIKTQLCIDQHLSFSESLATAYFRISENKDEAIFLQGNAFLAKLAKAVFEKDERLFAETCEKHADENYFLECTKNLEEQGFITAQNKNPWSGLYKTVLLFTEEYLATKCDLPILKVSECEENNENELKIIFAPQNASKEDLKNATLLPVESVSCSSDFLAFGTDFFDFLRNNSPTQRDFPIPNLFATGIMDANKFGACKDNKIYINHRLALDALRYPNARFLLLLTMLHEYGLFLGEDDGYAFASEFMEYSPANLFRTNFKFADLVIRNPNGTEQKFPLEISGLSYEQRKGLLAFFEYSEALESDDLELSTGQTIKKAKFFGLAKLPNIAKANAINKSRQNLTRLPGIANKGHNAISKTHQNLTKAGAQRAGIKASEELTDGSIWPDFPSEKELDLNIFYSVFVLSELVSVKESDTVYKSHFGENQFWHSMCPKLSKPPTNSEVREIILRQLEEWYSEALSFKEKGDMKNSLFTIGKLCHTVQDSFVLSHCWRRYYGDEKFIEEERIQKQDNGKIWSFQDYEAQDGNYHAMADSPTRNNSVKTIGYESAEYATSEILSNYSQNVSSIKSFLEKVYEIYPGRENETSGGSHPWFVKKNKDSRKNIESYLTQFSIDMG